MCGGGRVGGNYCLVSILPNDRFRLLAVNPPAPLHYQIQLFREWHSAVLRLNRTPSLPFIKMSRTGDK